MMGRSPKTRDNFSARTIEQLAKRVGYYCSNPDCRRPTIGPKSAPHQVLSVGVAAHICAAAPGGPRFDPSMSAIQRSSQDNGIWLCANCSRLIDADEERFRVDVLHGWKSVAEQEAGQRLGEKLMNRSDVQLAVREQVQTMYGAIPSAQSMRAVPNAHWATEQHLGSLDPRIEVKSTYDGHAHGLQLKALQQFSFALSAEPIDAIKARQAIRSLHAHGGKAVFEVGRLRLTGSPLLEHLSDIFGAGALEIHAEERPSTVRLMCRPSANGLQGSEVLLSGTGTGGTESFSITAKGLDGILGIELRIPVSEGAPNVEINFLVDTGCWNNVDVRLLPSFEALANLLHALKQGHELWVEAFVGSHRVGRALANSTELTNFIDQCILQMTYVANARIIADALSLEISFLCDHEFAEEEFVQLASAAATAQGTAHGTIKTDIEVQVQLTVPAESVAMAPGAVGAIRLVASEAKSIKVFGTAVRLPPVELEVPVCYPSLPTGSKAGDSVSLSFKPVPGAQALFAFAAPE